MTDPHLTVVILAFNEAQNLPGACQEILAVLHAMPVQAELLIVDDGSTDATGQIADALALEDPIVRAIHHGTNLGLGGGYRSGFAQARGQFLTFFPADGQFPADIIPQFHAEMPRADLVLGYIPDRRSSWVAKGLSLAERILYRALFGRMPRFQGIFMIRRTILAEVPLVSQGRGWAVVMELILRVSHGPYRIVSMPNELRPRASGESKVNNVRTIAANLRQVAALRKHLAGSDDSTTKPSDVRKVAT
jgi:glycosyltransferase involved in cell wall biosynthesis